MSDDTEVKAKYHLLDELLHESTKQGSHTDQALSCGLDVCIRVQACFQRISHVCGAGMGRAKEAAEARSRKLESEAATGLQKVKAGLGARLQLAEEEGIEAEARALEAEARAQETESRAVELEQALAETLASILAQVALLL